MIRDITIGQYYPGNSPLHRMDARVKIILTFVYIVVVFAADNAASYALFGVFTAGFVMLSGISFKLYFKSLKPVLIFVAVTAVINLFFSSGNVICRLGILSITDSGIKFAFQMVLRITFLIIGSSALTYTTSPIALTNGIERLLKPLSKVGVQSHEIAMMMTIALRFIPILLEETDKIMKAQMARGADFETGNLIRRAKAMVPLLVPLFISAFRRADDLAVAMESRCYSGGEGRTSLYQPKITAVDYKAAAVVIAFSALVIVFSFVF